MKVTTTETKDFTPFELTIKIESLDELKVLWAHMNPRFQTIKNIDCNIGVPFLEGIEEPAGVWDFWKVLNNRLIELGVKQ